MIKHHSVLVVGAGLSGLYAAYRLQQKNIDVAILEARDRIGGRILSPLLNDHPSSAIDLGPAWVWPELQPRLNQLLNELELAVFKQYTQGDMLYELDSNNVERYSGQSSHGQSYRVVGGTAALVNSLVSKLDKSSIYLNSQVTCINQQELLVDTVYGNDSYQYSADKIILALPLRILHHSIDFIPDLKNTITDQWLTTPTWMASHSKIVFVYETPFWREQNLSGEVFSRHGPLSEIYDGSPVDESFYALTSFVGLNAHQRNQIGNDRLVDLCKAQLLRLFGEASQDIKDIYVNDWSNEIFTSTSADLTGPMHHPEYSAHATRNLNNNILLAGTESAREHGGYLEGAIESAEEALSLIARDC